MSERIFDLDSYPVWTALVTPFTDESEVDYTCLRRLVARQEKAGNAILLLGSTGEGLALEVEEQKRIVEFVAELQPKVPLMVAVGGYNLASQLSWVHLCNQLPIDAFLLGSPLYAKPGVLGQKQWFQALLDEAEKPCMLYNVPSRSAVELSPEAIAKLQHHRNCWALKEASGDVNKFLAFRQICPDIRLYSGEDGLMPYLASAGAQGLVSVCANAWPEATHRYVTKALSGDLEGLFPVWRDATQCLFEVANPIPVKILMHHQQQVNSPVLRAPLTHKELSNQQALIRANNEINDWLNYSQSY